MVYKNSVVHSENKTSIAMDIRYFERIFHRLQPRLYAYCRKYIDDSEQARDIVQECFANLWEQQADIHVSCESYLFRAVHNRCVSYYRSMEAQAGYETSLRLQLREEEIHPDLSYPLTELYLKEIDELLRHCLEKLPERCRLIFEMSRYRNMQNREIAGELNLSIRTVEAQIYHALKIIREELKDYLPCLLLLFQR
ncbi:DNA-directed RNA polymerase sigma-70 factor [Bacteroidia bacterium]|nr:DNA-directed RNA polymerase sigma-70 factor [Bacteroidia bacterium]